MRYAIVVFITVFFFSKMSVASTMLVQSTKDKLISYTDIGQGEPLVLIHAFPADQQLWKSQQEGLKNHFRVITLDLWGFGQSTAVDGQAMTMTDYADEVKQLMDQLHIQKAIIGGESMGGYVTLAFLEKYPDLVEGLILSDTQSIADSPEMQSKREATAVDVLENGTTDFINAFMPKALSPNAPEPTKLFLKQILDAQAATAVASASRGMALRRELSDLLSNTLLPILILTGDQDVLISPKQSSDMHKLAKNSQLVVIANAGHLSSLEQSSRWNQAVIDMFYKPLNH